MSGSGEKSVVSLNLSDENVEWMDSQNKNRSAFVDDLITKFRSGGGAADDAVRRMRVQQLQTQIASKRKQAEMVEQEAEMLEDEMERLQSLAEQAEQKYYDELDDILDRLEESPTACHDVDFPRTRNLADMAPEPGHTAEDVMDDLRERADEQGRDIRDDQWESDMA